MLLREHVPALRYGAKIMASEVLGINTTGNVYYVIKATEDFYDQFVHDYHSVYADGSDSICADVGYVGSTAASAAENTGIQDALDKCVSSRGDYVVVVPSRNDYDLGAVLSMTKRNVHLVSPQNLGPHAGAMNGTRINQVDADASIINIAANNVEIAGLYLKSATTYPAITFTDSTDTSWGCSVHHNTIWWYGTTTYVVGVEAGGNAGGSYSAIEYNYFMPAGSSTTTTSVIFFENESSFVRANGNVIVNANSNTLSNGIYLKSVAAQASDNVIGDGGYTVTRALTLDTGIASGNMIGTANTADVAPAGNTNGFVGNWSGPTGGAAASQAA